MTLPVVIWSAHFLSIYAFTGFACARQMSGAVPWVVVMASAAAALALAAIALPAGLRAARVRQFPDFVGAGLAAIALVAIAWEASSLLSVPACV